jgi:ribosomal protein S10
VQVICTVSGVSAIRDDFPVLDRTVDGDPLVYLDNAATTQTPRQVYEVYQEFYEGYDANVHRGIHALSHEASVAYEEAHDRLAAFVGAGGGREEMVFTKNTTESLNLVAYGLLDELGPGDEVVTTEMEHHASLVTCQQVAEKSGAEIHHVRVDDGGRTRRRGRGPTRLTVPRPPARLRGRPREGRPGGRPRIPRRRAGVHRDSRLTRTGGFGAVRRKWAELVAGNRWTESRRFTYLDAECQGHPAPAMTFVTKIELQSGNRPALEQVVDEIRTTAERKGAELRGPHSAPSQRLQVSQYASTTGDRSRQFSPWEYTVYTRQMEIVGHNDVARQIAEFDFPEGVHVEVELEQIEQMA